MEYLKVFTDFAATLEQLGDAEIGRLFKAMLKYAESGEESDLRGNERFVWGFAKLTIDREREYNEKKRVAGQAGGLAKSTNSKQVVANVSTSKQDIAEDSTGYLKEKKRNEKKINEYIPPYNPPKGEWVGLVQEDVKSAFLDFIENRKKLKKPMTERAMTMLANRLNELTSDPKQQIEMLNEAILHGWQSVYPPKQEKGRAAVTYIQKKYNDDELLGMAVNLDD